MNLNHNISIIKSSLSILSKWIVPRLQSSKLRQNQYKFYIKFWEKKINTYITHYGVYHASQRAKTIRAITLAYLSGKPIKVVKEFISINKEGIPKDLIPLRDLIISKDPVDLKFLITLLSVTKVLKDQPRPNLESIEKEFTGKVDQEWSIYIERFFSFLKVKPNSLESDFAQYHLSTKTSPNFRGALGDSLNELLLIKEVPKLQESIYILGGKILQRNMDTLTKRLKPLPSIGDNLRRVSYISDKECKTRIVAILDYWSQTALLPLHNSLFKLLSRIEADQTFNQDGFKDRLKSGPYFSFDLKDATDRFPIILQKLVLSYLIGESKSEAWSTILNHLEYKLPHKGSVKYNTGQPMGAYSSWATFTLSHHIVVQRAAMECNNFPFSNYAILGDDIVICDRDVASKYEQLMLDLGVEFSKTKTFKSEMMFEFASRIFISNIEISPFSLKGVWESTKRPASCVEFIRTMQSHGWNLLREGNIPGQIRSLIRLTGRPTYRSWDTLINVFYYLPLKAFLKGNNDISAVPLLRKISCFENQYVQILQNAMISELRDKVEKRIEEITELHVKWAETLITDDDEIFKSEPGDYPIPPAFLPLFGNWHRLKREARTLAAELSDAYENPEVDYPLEKWVDQLVGISNTPDVSKVLGERKHKRIILTSSSLILAALRRASK